MYSLLTADVEKRISNFEKIRKIGEGTYGEVFEALDKSKNMVMIFLLNSISVYIYVKESSLKENAYREQRRGNTNNCS